MIIPQISPVNTNNKICSNLTCAKVDRAQIPYEQNGLSFAQAQALKSSRLANKITFGRIIAPSYDIQDVAKVQELLAKCRYGKKDLIYGDISQVRTRITDQGVSIENFYTPDDSPDGNIYGNCEELAYKVGRRLQKMFGDKYLVFVITGENKKEFPLAHKYLGMLHNTPENKELLTYKFKIQSRHRRLCREFMSTNAYKSFPKTSEELDKLKGTDLGKQHLALIEKFTEKSKKLSSNLDRESLANSLIIDPSLSKVEEFGAGNLYDDYIHHIISSLRQVNAVPARRSFLVSYTPVGYLEDLVPEATNDKNKRSMVYIFPHDKGIAPLGSEELADFISKGDRTHPFFKFMIKLNEAFKKGADKAGGME